MSIIPIGIMEASKAAPAIDIAAIGGGYRGGGDVLLFAFWRSPLMFAALTIGHHFPASAF
jgi:hypothetical protein